MTMEYFGENEKASNENTPKNNKVLEPHGAGIATASTEIARTSDLKQTKKNS